MIQLYDFPQCPFCRKVRIVLAEKGIDYQQILVDLRKKEQKRENFLKLNPYGKVPVLVEDGLVIYESTVIGEYLEEKYPHPPLMPAGPAERARVRILVDFCESHFHDPWFNAYVQMKLRPEDKRDKELIKESKDKLREHLGYLNRLLEKAEYLVGAYSLADIAFAPRVSILDSVDIPISPELRNVSDWIERMKSRPSYQAMEL